MIKEHLPFILIVVGLANIFIIYYIRYRFNKTMHLVNDIIELNKTLNYDFEKFLEHLQNITNELKIKDYGYEVYYFDEIIAEKNIKFCSKDCLSQNIKAGDYEVLFKMEPAKYIGEYKIRYDLIFKTLCLIIQEDLYIKKEAAQKSFENISKFHTFILHDIKNISQFFQTLSYNLEKRKTQEEKNKLLEYLQKYTVSLNEKNLKVLKLLELNSNENLDSSFEDVDIKALLNDIVHIYDLECEIKGELTLHTNKTAIYLILENLVKNLKEKQYKEKDIKIFITLEKKGEKSSIVFEDTGSKIENINKIFEPFYTTKNKGLGVGLYKVKTLLQNINGSVKVTNVPNVTFTLSWG